MDFFRIECFLKAAETGNMTRAAEQLNMTQPAISFQIRELERELQLTLFDRDRGGICLTEPGRVMRDGFARMLENYQQLLDRARSSALSGSRLTIGYYGPVNWAGLHSFIAAFSRRHPDVEVAILQQQWRELADYLEHGAIDVAFLESSETTKRTKLASRPLFSEGACFAAAPAHPIASQDSVSAGELRDEMIFVNNHISDSLTEIHSRLARSGLRPEQLRHYDGSEITLAMAAAGQGLAIIPRSFRVESSALRYVNFHTSGNILDYSLAWSKSSSNPAVDLFCREASEVSWPVGFSSAG
ncbi:MAG: LysR family transcriptional regulator [Oscillospiraceae bacterium]|nr:LysR family transcriptional regulator [Oscillospiraceae bacterium]